MTADETPSAATISYEQARDELVTIVARLEAGDATLEEALTLWERGELLAAIAQEHLDGAQARLDAARGDAAPDAAPDASTSTDPA